MFRFQVCWIYACVLAVALTSCGKSVGERVTLRVELKDKHGEAGKFNDYGLRTYRDPIHYLTGSTLETFSARDANSPWYSMDLRTDEWIETVVSLDALGASAKNAVAWESRQFFPPFEVDSKPQVGLLVSNHEQRAVERAQSLGEPYSGDFNQVLLAWLQQWAQPEFASLTGAYTVSGSGSFNEGGHASFGWWTIASHGDEGIPREIFGALDSTSRDFLGHESVSSQTGFTQREFRHRRGTEHPLTKVELANFEQAAPAFTRSLSEEIATRLDPVESLMIVPGVDMRGSFSEEVDYGEWTIPIAQLNSASQQPWEYLPESVESTDAIVRLRILNADFGHDVELVIESGEGAAQARWTWRSISQGAPYLRATEAEYSPGSSEPLHLRVANFYDFGAFTVSQALGYWDALFATAEAVTED